MDNETEQRIHRMSDVLASQVAAGEVVERPASVVKELIDNSIDAGATMVRVEIIRGGVSLIKVTDNGCGMSRADALLCLERHATSKLSSYEDLSCIEKLGFRGEALPSIASVAELRITTRREEDMEGTVIACNGGEMEPPSNAGCAPGTEICVRNLFYNTPVRRKFLKSNETESGHIEHEIKLHALAYPHLRFVFVRDGQLVFDWPATGDLRQRLADFAGRELAASLLRIKPQMGPGVHVSGYLMPLSEARRNRRLQFIFLNTRAIDDKIIARAVRDGYGGFPTGLHPALFLYLDVEPALVDVNVHPAKKEVRFLRPSDITNTVMDAVAATLAAHARGEQERQLPPQRTSGTPLPVVKELRPVATPTPAPVRLSQPTATVSAPTTARPTQPAPAIAPKPAPVAPLPAVREVKSVTPVELQPIAVPARPTLTLKPVMEPIQRELTLPSQTVEEPKKKPESAHVEPAQAELRPEGREQEDYSSRASSFRFIGISGGRYLLFENQEGLVLLSPRAARERVIYERLLNNNNSPVPTQRLLQPVMLELDARDVGVALDVSQQLEKAGFRLSLFGQRTMRIDGVPMMLPLHHVSEFVYELIRTFSSGELRLRRARNPFEPYAQQIARRYAAGEDLQPWLKAPVPLLNDLLNCEIPYCTPGGKPTLVPVSFNEIERKFQSR